MHEVRFRFTPEFIASATRRDFVGRSARVLGAMLVAFAAVVLGLMDGELSPLVVTVMALGLGVTVATLRRRFHGDVQRTYQLWLKESPQGEVLYQLQDDAIQIQLGHASSRYAWTDFQRLRRYDDVWLLELGRRANVFFPVEAAAPEALEYLTERCRTAEVPS